MRWINLPVRWWVLGVFMLSSTLNYLDRQLLAAMAPTLKTEFGLNNQDYGLILSVFSITYAISSPLAGLFLDRVGLRLGMSLAVGFWSLAGMARGLATGLPGLVGATAALGIGEAAGIPSSGKAGALYLLPKERAIGGALSQIGLSLGSIAAPLIVTYCLTHHNWRTAFIFTGALGFLWIPVWMAVERTAPKQSLADTNPLLTPRQLLRQRQMWGFIGGNFFSMTVYSLWTNWTTVFLTTEFGLTPSAANQLAGWPHFFAYFGAVAGGAISYRLIARGMEPLAARRRALLICALAILTTATVPLMPTPGWAIAMISVSFFFASGWGVNYYAMPVDAFGQNAAFAVSLLTMAYGILQIFLSPQIGRTIDQFGFRPVCVAAAVMPLAGLAVVHWTRQRA